ncbi:MAG: hypothetical protein ACRCT8_00070 [Lacipirellulaceae bacterium]
MSEQDLRTASGGSGSDNFARQFAWSSNGQVIYAIDSSPSLGGLYRIDATRWANSATGVTRIWNDGGTDSATDRASMRSEPTVVPTSVFDYAPSSPLVGDQIVVEGSFDAGNSGGVSVFVDTGGASLAAPTVLFTESQFRAFSEYRGESRPRYVSIASDPTGDLFFYEQQTDGLFKYDTSGRFVKLLSEREHNLFQAETTGNANGNDDMSNFSVRKTTAPGFSVTELVFVDSTVNAPIGVLSYKIGDFDRNNQVNASDFALLAAALRSRGVAADDVNNRFDLNGNAVLAPDPVSGVLEHVSNGQMVIDWKDVKILQQFTTIPTGDVNFDLALNFTDIDVMNANYFTTPGGTNKTWVLGDVASIDPLYAVNAADVNLVNRVDLDATAAAWVALGQAKPTSGQLSSRYSGTFLTDVTAAFAAVGIVGDYNRDGVVNAADYTVWRDTLGSTSDLRADGDLNGSIGSNDYTVWRNRYGATSSTSVAVPEPGGVLLVAAGFVSLGARHRCYSARRFAAAPGMAA